MVRTRYQHTQVGRMLLIMFALAALVIGTTLPLAGWTARHALALAAALLAPTALLFGTLRISVDDACLRWSFGIGLLRFKRALADIMAVETTRTTVMEGWGIHLTRRGWLYNLSGFDAVLIHRRDGKSFMLGTDEPQRLARAIQAGIDTLASGARVRRP